jgi:hypothetical protein
MKKDKAGLFVYYKDQGEVKEAMILSSSARNDSYQVLQLVADPVTNKATVGIVKEMHINALDENEFQENALEKWKGNVSGITVGWLKDYPIIEKLV